MKEVIELKRYNENTTLIINEMQSFGWQLKNSNLVGHDSIVGGGFNGVHTYTNVHSETASLTFERDTDMPFFNELNKLYEEYKTYTCPLTKVPNGTWSTPIPFTLFAALYGLVMFILGCVFGTVAIIIIGLLAVIGFIVLFVFLDKKRKNKIKTIKSQNQKIIKYTEDNVHRLTNAGKEILNRKESKEFFKVADKIQSNQNSDIDIEKIKELKNLYDQGIITEEEFTAGKNKLLNK